MDRSLQQTQAHIMAGLTAVAYEAEQAMKIRAWFSALKEDEKEELPPEIARLGKSYVKLMDASLLFTKSVGDITSLRRKLVKNDLVEPYKWLFDDDKNPATANWLAGEDINAAIRKAKDSAVLVDKITKQSTWSNNGRKRTFSNDRRNSRGSGGFPEFRPRERSGTRQDGHGFQTNRGRGNGFRDRGNSAAGRSLGREDRQDFYRRDSR